MEAETGAWLHLRRLPKHGAKDGAQQQQIVDLCAPFGQVRRFVVQEMMNLAVRCCGISVYFVVNVLSLPYHMVLRDRLID
jgi:hypothetical protein